MLSALLRRSMISRIAAVPRFLLGTPAGWVTMSGAGLGWAVMQHKFGCSDNFFEGRFVTDKDPDAVVDFYSAEELLKIIAIFPFAFDFVMAGVKWDTEAPTEEGMLLSLDESHMLVQLVGMEVSFEIIETEIETADGETVVASFSRHERFINYVPLLPDLFGIKILLWDQTWDFGYNRLADGRLEVHHKGEKFHGPWPVPPRSRAEPSRAGAHRACVR
jgi:hypothetical protein